jgi:hypothetical protein
LCSVFIQHRHDGTSTPSDEYFDHTGKTMAILRSFVGSCELVKVDPWAWFQDVLSRIGEQPLQALEELLPHRWAEAQAQVAQ